MDPQQIKALIEAGLPGASAHVVSNDGVHFQARIVCAAFEGKPLIQRHRMVNALLQEYLDSGAVHAISLTTLTPEQAAQA
jgi:Predicted transcriptional regulator, BolA superfamily